MGFTSIQLLTCICRLSTNSIQKQTLHPNAKCSSETLRVRVSFNKWCEYFNTSTSTWGIL